MNKQEIEKALSWVKEVINHQVFERATYEDTYGTGDLSEEERKEVYEEMDNNINLFKTIQCALNQQLNNGWIPVSSGRLPEDTDGDNLATVYICMKFKDSPFGNDDAVYQDVVDFMTDKKIWLIEDDFEVTAWRPRFEPYKEVSE